MSQKLIYEIAGHQLLINTPNAGVTVGLIPSFAPFRVNSEGEGNVLFQLWGSREVAIPSRAPDDTMEVDGATFELFHVKGSVTVLMRENKAQAKTNSKSDNKSDSITVKNSDNKCINKSNNKREHCFSISADRRTVITDITLVEPYESQFLAYFLRAAFGMAGAHHNTIKMHASVIEREGKALVFMGKSGTGKSTHSRLWQEFVPGCQLLNDDEPIVRLLNDGSVMVYGAPWSGSTPCYKNASAQVAAFVRLYQSPENKLSKLKGVHSFASLFESVAILRSDQENRELISTTIGHILEQVPVYRLDNRPNREAVALTETLMA
ncbi:MAG: hypothetical protein WCR71_00620 [Bacteroidales bacterium]